MIFISRVVESISGKWSIASRANDRREYMRVAAITRGYNRYTSETGNTGALSLASARLTTWSRRALDGRSVTTIPDPADNGWR